MYILIVHVAVAVDVQFLHQDIHRSTAKGNVYILTKNTHTKNRC